ncbi:hypothetical protein GEMRC1_009329 [Eukaryota sp. GEM-RC1]
MSRLSHMELISPETILNSADFQHRIRPFSDQQRADITSLVSSILHYATDTLVSRNNMLQTELDRVLRDYTSCQRSLSKLQAEFEAKEQDTSASLSAASEAVRVYSSQLDSAKSELSSVQHQLSESQRVMSSNPPTDLPSATEMYFKLQEVSEKALNEEKERKKLEQYLNEILETLEEKQVLLNQSFAATQSLSETQRISLHTEALHYKEKSEVQADTIEKLKIQIAHLLTKKGHGSTVPGRTEVLVYSDYYEAVDTNAELLQEVASLKRLTNSQEDKVRIHDLEQTLQETRRLYEQYKEEVQMLNRKVYELESELDYYTESTQDLSKTRVGRQVSVSAPEFIKLKESNRHLETVKKELEQSRQSLIENIEILSQNLAGVRTDNSDLRRESNDQRAALGSMQKEFQSLMSKYNDLVSSKASVDKALSESFNQLATKKIEVEHLEKVLEDVGAERHELAQKVFKLELSLQKETQRAQHSSSTVVSLIDEIETLKKQLDQRSTEINDLRSTIYDLRSQPQPMTDAACEDQSEIIGDLQSQLASLNEEIGQKSDEIRSISESNDDLISQTRSLTALIDQFKTKEERTTQMIDNLRDRISALTAENTNYQTQIQNCLSDSESKLQRISDLTNEVNSLQSRLHESSEQISNLTRIFAEKDASHEEEIVMLENSIKSLTERQSRLDCHVNSLNDSIRSLQQEKAVLQSQIDGQPLSDVFQQSMDNFEEERLSWQSEIQVLNETIAKISRELSEKDKQLVTIRAKVVTHDFTVQQHGDVLTRNSELLEQVSNLNAKIQELMDEIAEKSSEIESLTVEKHSLASSINQLKTERDELTLKSDDVSEKLSAKETEYNELKQKFISVRDNASKWKNRARELQEKKPTASSEELKEELESLNKTVIKLRDLSKLKQNLVVALRKQVSSLKAERPKTEKKEVAEKQKAERTVEVEHPMVSEEPPQVSEGGFFFEPSSPVKFPAFPSAVPSGPEAGGFVFGDNREMSDEDFFYISSGSDLSDYDGSYEEEAMEQDIANGFTYEIDNFLSEPVSPPTEPTLPTDGFHYTKPQPQPFVFEAQPLVSPLAVEVPEEPVSGGFSYRPSTGFYYEPNYLGVDPVEPPESGLEAFGGYVHIDKGINERKQKLLEDLMGSSDQTSESD